MTKDISYDMNRQYTMFRQYTQKCVLALLLLLGSAGVKAADYVFIYNGGYLAVDNNGNVTYTSNFNPQCVWTCVSNTDTNPTTASLDENTNRHLYTTLNETKYWLIDADTNGGEISVSTNAPSSAYWRNSNNRLYSYTTSNSRTFYLYYRGNAWRTSRSTGDGNNYYAATNWYGSITTDYRSTTYTVTTTPHNTPVDNTSTAIFIEGINSNTITLNHDNLGGSYTPVYTTYRFNYPSNNSDHNYYNGADYGSTAPSVNASTLSPQYAWSHTSDGGGVASIDPSTGELTVSGDVTGDITVRLTISNISPLADKTVDYTLTRASVAQNVTVNTELTNLSISPAPATINYGGSQAFTGSATATTTTTTVPAHITLTHGSTTYYYFNGTLYESTDGFKSVVTTNPPITYAWNLTGPAAGGFLTPTSGTGSSITINHANAAPNNTDATLTLTASTENNQTKTTTTTVTATQTMPTSITADVASIAICQGSTATIGYTLSPAGSHNSVTVTSTNDAIAYYTGAAATNGIITIHAGNTVGTATLTLTAATGVTTTLTVTTQEKVIPPAITFDNTTNEVTISSETAGATIYYTTDGHVPTTASTHGATPVTFTISSYTSVNAMADKDGLCNSGERVTKNIEKLPAPTVTVGSDGRVEMACAVSGVMIHYTTDGTDPTATTGTDYNSPIALPGGTTVKAIAIKDDYINSDVTSEVLQIPAETPVINISKPSGSVEITCATTGATIYYTTDGSEPTTSSSTYSTQFTVSNGVTVKAIAVATGYAVSEVASNRFMLDSGTSGGTVTLNDAEDHSWSYYSDPDCPIRSLNPADVKITYYGNGTKNISTTNGATPASNSWTEDASGVKVGPNDDYNTFVYYKTLERLDGGTSNNPTGLCEYTTIPNPFSVRPTFSSGYGTGSNNTYTGFYMWRIKEIKNGKIYDAATNGSQKTAWTSGNVTTANMLYADRTYYFEPDGEYGMEVELEALWARAYVLADRASYLYYYLNSSDLQSDSYERNFYVCTGTYNSGSVNVSGQKPVTISTYYPDGTAAGTSSTINNSFTCNANTKLENISFNAGSYTFTANNHDLIIGRGCTGTVNYVRGLSANASSPSYTIRLESGTFNYYALVGGYVNNESNITVSGTPNIKAIFGCDYDRALDKKNSSYGNALQIVTTAAFGRGATICNDAAVMANETFKVWVKSGQICSSYDMSDYLANFTQTLYMSGHYANHYVGKRKLFIEGGEIAGVAGGIDANGENSAYRSTESLRIRMNGGHIRGAMYGGGAQATSGGTKTMIITGGTITGWLGAGANGTSDAGGQTWGAGRIYFGGKAKSGGTGSNNSINGSVGGIIFGAGNGTTASTTSGSMQNGTTVVIADECEVERDVYGGGNLGYAVEESNVYILGGTVNGGVYGGANQKLGPEVNILMKDGLVKGGIYGGSNTTGVVSGPVTMQIDGGQVGADADHPANIHGGGYGQPTVITGNVDITLGTTNQSTPGVVVYGDVYGGSALGSVNGTSTDASKHTTVTLNKGDVHGNVYGGALGSNSIAANVYGPVTVTVNGGSVTNADGTAGVFGCNNVNGAPQSTVTVTINGTDDAGVDNVFGGGNRADYTPPSGQPDFPTVTMTGGLVNNSVFGGGNEADIKGNANVSISGGTVINRVFGGGNLGSVGTFSTTTSVTGHSSHTGCIGWPSSTGSWSVGGKCTVTVSGGKIGKDNMTMPQDFGYVFGASRGETIDPAIDADIDFRAYVKETEVTISGTAFILGGVYGGSENGHVRGNTWVKIQGGQIGCGVGKTAAYTAEQWSAAETAVKTGNASDINSAAADMPECASWRYQNPYLPYDMNDATEGGSTTGSDGHTFYGNVFGGGSGYFPYAKQGGGYEWNMKAGLVEGNTKVEISGGHILTSIYGGNEMTNVAGNCEVIMTGGTLGVPRTLAQSAAHPVTCYLFGAGKGDQRTHFAESTNVDGNTSVTVEGGTIFGSVFGGGEDGHVKGNATITIGKDDHTGPHIGTWGTSYVDGNIFGAGRGFAGESLTSGVVQGNVTIDIKGGTMLGSVYGGGRLASVGTYLVATDNANYGKLMGSTGDTSHGNVTINITGGTIGNSHEYIVPTGNWDQSWKDTYNVTYTEFGSSGTDENRLMHTKGGNVFAGCMGRLYKLNGITPISNWPDLGKVRKTVLNISGGTIKSNVYGGGEFGTVAEGTTIKITGGTIGTEVGDVGGKPSYTFGSVFGGGYGSEDNINGSLNDTRSIVNSRDHAGLVTGNTDIDISGNSTRIWASVYGGGELAKTAGNTDISISDAKIGKEVVWRTGDTGKPDWANDGYVRYGGYRMGNVFGGGKGSIDYTAAGLVTGNAKVTISSGYVYHNVYGGGAIGSVGTFISSGGTTTCAENTGKTEVIITGGQIGITGYDNGMVNGASRGLDGDPHGSNLDRVAWVNNSIVKIGTDGQGSTFDTPIVHGSIYGGGENGHNFGNTEVNIYSGTVGNTTGTYEHGNIYGAGCGTDTYTSGGNTYYNPMAGVVLGTGTVNVKGGHVTRNVYGGGSMGTTEGKATVNVTGGRIGSAYGGPKGKEGARTYENELFAYCGDDTEVNINYGSTPASDDGSTTQCITGSVYGGGEAGSVKGSVVVNMQKGLVLNDVYGGGALADTNIDNATNYGQLSETINSTTTKTTAVNLIGGAIGNNVFGGGLGRKAKAAVAYQAAQPAQGNEGDPDYVPAVPEIQAQDAVTANPAYVYGDVTVKLNETTATNDCVVRGAVHGANNYSGTPKGEVTVHIYKTVNDGANVKAVNKDNTTYNLKAVYGGGNEAAFIPVDGKKANVIIEGCGDTSIKTVYGGGNAASVPDTHVIVNSCYEIGTIFGGGNGLDDLDDGTPNPGAHVGYKPADYTYDTSKTRQENINLLDAAFNSQKSTLVYGNGEAKVDALGGTIHKVFGGSNTKGNVRHESVAYVDGSNSACPLVLGEVFGGGNEAFMDGGSSVKLGCIEYMEELYGGANAADVGGDIVLTITSGRFNRVFGGNNVSGTIHGSITVNIEETGCHPIVIGELYGCGNQAPYETPGTKHPTINAKSFTSIGRIFGGGLGASAEVTGSPEVNINEVLGDHHNGSVAAGAYNYDTNATTGHFDTDGNFKEWTVTLDGTEVKVPAHTKGKIGAIGTIFGGGNAAKVTGNTIVNVGTNSTVDYVSKASGETTPRTGITVLGADIRGNVFGGGNQAEVTGNTNVTIGKPKEPTTPTTP